LTTGSAYESPEGRGDDVVTSCGPPGAEDLVWSFVAPESGRYLVSAGDVDSFAPVTPVVEVLAGCGGRSLGCGADTFSGQASVVVELVAGESILVVLEAPHPYAPSYLAWVPVTVALARASESCQDGADDDLDGATDCDDPECAGEPRCDCLDGELMAEAPLLGTTVGATSSFTSQCSYEGGHDRSHRFVAPTAGRWSFRARSAAAAVVSLTDRCGGREYACDNRAHGFRGGDVELDLAAGEEAIVRVETRYGDGPFVLEAVPCPAGGC
jgi:hypothetical protein